MLRSSICLSKSFSSFTKVFKHNLLKKQFQQCFLTTVAAETQFGKGKESTFIAQFVPNYVNEKKYILNQSKFEIEENYSLKTADEMLEIFEELSYYCAAMNTSITDEQYDKIISALIGKLPEMTDEEIVTTLVNLTRFPKIIEPRARNYNILWKKLDDECWERSRYWKYPYLLKVMNIFYKLGLNKISPFNSKALLKMTRKIDEMEPRVLVEMMFYQSIIRHKDVPMYNVEARFAKILDELNIDEIGIICLAFFKRESKLLDHSLINRLYIRTTKELDNIKDITFVNILKILRYSSKPSHCDLMDDLCENILPVIENFGLMTCHHIALIGTNLQNCHQKLIERIIEKYNDNVKTVRLKDLDRMCLVIALYDFKTESQIEITFLKNVLEELRTRVNEITNFPRCFISSVNYLSMKGIYDVDLLKACLKESFIHFAYGKNYHGYSRELLALNSFVKINLKGIYDGPELTERIRKGIATFQSHYIPYRGQKWKLTHSDNVTLDIQEYTEIKYGKNVLTQVLPHFERPDIIYCFDENGQNVTPTIAPLLNPRDVHSGIIFSKQDLLSQVPELAENMDKYRMISIIIGGWNYYLRNTNVPTGVLRMKIDQLKMIGYIPVLVYWHDWMRKPMHIRQELFDEKMKQALSL